jgi:Kef-type K+ transport system membrane component KefB
MGRQMKHLKLPSIVGFMLVGVIFGPSVLDLVHEDLRSDLSFVTEVALAFVALSIGLELRLSTLRRQGSAILVVILVESMLAFLVVLGGVYLVTRDLPLALIFGAIAPASAPAGTVAVIQEYRASGSLTRALYSVVGFDDGLAIIIFGFASAAAGGILSMQIGGDHGGFLALVQGPILEIVLSILTGFVAAYIYSLLAKRLSSPRDVLILTFAIVLITTGLAAAFHMSLILTNMVLGMVVVNSQPGDLIRRIREQISEVLPLLFVLFFVLAGANLHLGALPSLGLVGVVYFAGRVIGLVGGSWIGGTVGKAEMKIRKYLGMGILSQAGVAIGLALIVKQEFAMYGEPGLEIGSIVITAVTATSILFEILGPITTKIALRRAGEINEQSDEEARRR